MEIVPEIVADDAKKKLVFCLDETFRIMYGSAASYCFTEADFSASAFECNFSKRNP